MARTKQTARKDTGGKPLAMGRGRGKGNLKKDPKPGGRADRKVVLEYSSDETPDENNPQPAEGAEAPKRVKKQIHLTLPTSPAHVTTTETFATFFINHGLTRALQKAFAKRGWSTDQMREFVANFQKKHGSKSPCLKSTGTKTPLTARVWSWRTAPQWARRQLAAQAAPAGANRVRRLQPVVTAVEWEDQVVAMVPVQVVAAVPAQVVAVA